MGRHQRDEPQPREVFGRQCSHHVLGTGIPPRSMSIDAGAPCALGVEPEAAHFCFPRARRLPLPPHHTPQSSPYPRIQFFNRPATLREAEVIHPSTQDRVEAIDGVRQRPTPALCAYLPDGVPQAFNAGLGDANFSCRAVWCCTPETFAPRVWPPRFWLRSPST